jgi:diadenosine tetraphosphatase ApaH/serine/threonine PP2A family protein phosphatase
MHRRWVALVGGLLVIGASTRVPHSQTPDPICAITTTERVVAVGDVHGAHAQFVAILRAASLIDGRNRWSGRRAILVQTGDVLDRGTDSRQTLDLLRKLEGEARRAGGQVIALIGNHEVMRMVNDLRYVSAGEYDAFRQPESPEFRENVRKVVTDAEVARAKAAGEAFDATAFREQFLRDVPLGLLEMRRAFMPGFPYGDWLRSRKTVARINGVAFVHGGIADDVASLGCQGINETVAREMKSLPIDADKVPQLLAAREDGPLWYRGLAQEPEDTFAPTLTSILRKLDARAIVVGHTPTVGKITTRFGRQVVMIDTGMLNGTFYRGGTPTALEMQGGQFTAVYLDRRELLGSVPPAVPAS